MKTCLLLLVLILIGSFALACELVYLTNDDIEVTGEYNPPICISWHDKRAKEKQQGISYSRERKLNERIGE